ncbi:MAG: efflux RND transporter periplasmic adaptor subunit [Rhodoferax sp.]|nr:efflux RND transporter periplasmic adaptor subunit [Rhodoferax sp.]
MTTPSTPPGNPPPVAPLLLTPPEPPTSGPANAAAATAAPGAAPPASAADKAGIAALLDEPPVRVWFLRPWVWGSTLLAVALVAGIWVWQARKAANAAPHYSTQAASMGNLTLTVTANGTLQPTRSINIGSELSGTVLKVNVDVNDRVKKGQVLVVLDTAKLGNQILRSQATVASAASKTSQTAATLTEARATLARLEEVARLSGGRVPSLTELDTARATVSRAVADDASARASVRDAEAALATDQINLGKASITAPSDGIVLTRTVDPGNAVAATLQAVTLFTVAEDLGKLRLWVYVDEADVGAVKVGQKASFTVSAFLARQFPATITRVGFGSTITDNVVTYLTYLDVDNADLSLRPGMTATATITATQRSNVLLVPNSALRFTPTSSAAKGAPKKSATASLLPRMPGNNTRKPAAEAASTALAKQVWVLPADGKGEPTAVAVTPGISDGRMTEITGGDLKAGMLVVTDKKLGNTP